MTNAKKKLTPREKQAKALRRRKYPWATLVATPGNTKLALEVGDWVLTDCRQINRRGWRVIKYERPKPVGATRGRYSLALVWDGERLANNTDARDLDRYPELRDAVLEALRKYDSTAEREYWVRIRRQIQTGKFND